MERVDSLNNFQFEAWRFLSQYRVCTAQMPSQITRVHATQVPNFLGATALNHIMLEETTVVETLQLLFVLNNTVQCNRYIHAASRNIRKSNLIS